METKILTLEIEEADDKEPLASEEVALAVEEVLKQLKEGNNAGHNPVWEVKRVFISTPPKKTIREQLLADAEGSDTYIKDVAERGCIGGNCNNLIYYNDTRAFYAKHADEIDEILGDIEEQMGEPYNIGENMKRLGQSDLRNFLAWMAYEVRAQEIMSELENEE